MALKWELTPRKKSGIAAIVVGVASGLVLIIWPEGQVPAVVGTIFTILEFVGPLLGFGLVFPDTK